MVLRPLLMTRIANTAPGVALATLAWLLHAVPAGRWFACLAPMAAGVFLAVRGYRMSVVITGEHITVRGLRSSRTIRRADVVALTSLPSLRWQRPSGRDVHTPPIMFMEIGRVLPAVAAHNEACLDRLSRALRRRR
ncbi:hypothetical protein ACN26Y_05505 [Micromonospora sp. WMMD558]|uniref:hypothetical protein n=1 Tax=unclassified Micromonospora TaxID=2617518 RepID=UPI0012B48AD9|nr:hypothetical protein [Micromonospora sp. WMMC415]QGN45783.1 hypothetical protein GKC29_02200 [Micromonospora sp. WMMC415]